MSGGSLSTLRVPWRWPWQNTDSQDFLAGSRWYKDGALLTLGNRYRMVNEPRSGMLVLVIQAASKEDLGHYECEVRHCGKDNSHPPGSDGAQAPLYRCRCSRLTRGHQTAVTHRHQPPVLCLVASPFTLGWVLLSCPLAAVLTISR